MDIVAMKVKDLGLLVEDDSTNIDKLVHEQTISKQEGALLKEFNGSRNAIAHKYNRLDTATIQEARERIAEFVDLIFTIAG
jgi:uncharacterized protein YutE (UPF0331/DUF86 family)